MAKLTDLNRLSLTHPHLVDEWDFEKNQAAWEKDPKHPRTPEEVSYGSKKKPWWRCKDYGHSWDALVKNRAKLGYGCRVCSGKEVSDLNRLSLLRPEVAAEWDYEKNFPLIPEDVSYASNEERWWSCVAGHSWPAIVWNRTNPAIKSGCPYCSGYYVTDKNSIAAQYPEVAKEWHPTKNGDRTPENTSYAAHYLAWWQCSEEHVTQSYVANRTYLGHQCGICANIAKSKISQIWLDLLGVPDIHGVTREVVIMFDGGFFKVDGFDPTTNTVYEFLGDYWHGNLNIFSAEEKNGHNGKTFGFLFAETNRKLDKLRDLDYTVVSIWEADFRKDYQP